MSNLDELDGYVLKANKREEKKLNKQRNEGIKECRRVHKLLNKRTFKKEREFIEKKMIVYIAKMKWIPWSYRRFLDAWQDRHKELGGK